MPFLKDEGGTEQPLGEAGSTLPAATLVVHPDQVLQLKRRLEDRRDKIVKFIEDERDNLTHVPPPGADPCSARVVQAFGKNGQEALEATQGFVNELNKVIDSLDEAARMYGLVEESNTDTFRGMSR